MTIAETYARSRLADVAARLRQRAIRRVTVRPDGLVLRIVLDDGTVLRVSAEADSGGTPRLDVDVFHAGIR
jgi:hypothetical protein